MPKRHSRLRLGYLSAELRTHPIPCLVAQLFEEHDRSCFEVFAFSYGDDDGTPMRRRLEQAFDGFFDVRGLSDEAIARRIREQEIDIMVDLTGHTAGSRLEILASRPAPVQLHYIGHPGTLGADFIDYLIVDPFVVPAEEQQHYSEALVYLSQCYQANDRKRTPADHRPSRAGAGLPPDGLVFCCFNQTYKITPPFFGAWMRLLHAVPGSVLWLLADNRWAEENSPARGGLARGVAGSAGLRAAAGGAGAPGAPRPGGPVPRHVPVQRPHRRERRVVDGAAGADLCGARLRVAGRGQPAARGGAAGAGHPRPGGGTSGWR